MSASEEDLTWYFPRADTASFVQLNVVLCDWILILKQSRSVGTVLVPRSVFAFAVWSFGFTVDGKKKQSEEGNSVAEAERFRHRLEKSFFDIFG